MGDGLRQKGSIGKRRRGGEGVMKDEDLPRFKFDLLDDEIIIFNLNNQPVQNPYLL
jgi:hypothetical protein